MARVRVFRKTFGESVREIVMRRALNETYGSGGDIQWVVVTTRRSGLGCARCTHTREDKESRLSWEGMTYGK